MWSNRLIEVNLTERKVEYHDLEEELLRRTLGGRFLGVELLRSYGIVEPEESPIILAATPLAPFGAPAASRLSLVSRSPLTRTVFDSNAGGDLCVRLKNCNADAVVIKGSANKTVVVKITPEGVTIEDAPESKNSKVGEFLRRLPKTASCAVAGPAAFSGFRYASVMVSEHNAFGRGGLGRLFGMKNIKALIVDAPLSLKRPNDRRRYRDAVKAILRLFTASPAVKALSLYGTPFLVRITNWLSILPVNNFRRGGSDGAEPLCAENIIKARRPKSKGCFACPIKCKKRSETALPEFETLALVGASCGVFDFSAIAEVNGMANDYGVDTISLGGTLAAFFELEGVKPDGGMLVETVRRLLSGDAELGILKEGARIFCESRGAPEVAMCVKGLELPGYDPRGAAGMALAYATSNRGGCHLRAYMVAPEVLRKPRPLNRFSLTDKVNYLRVLQDRFGVCDSLGVCKFAFLAAGEEEYAELLSAAVGVEYSAEDLMRIGAENYDSERAFNEACGFTEEDDTLPERFFTEPASDTVPPLDREKFLSALSEFYTARGWKSHRRKTDG